jgi:Na+/melibiose symporter-like transporter
MLIPTHIHIAYIYYLLHLPPTKVHVGNIHFLVGYLNYQTSIWDHKPFRYGIIGGACAVVLFILVLIACCACRSRGDTTSTKDSRERPRSYISAYESKGMVKNIKKLSFKSHLLQCYRNNKSNLYLINIVFPVFSCLYSLRE